MFSFLCLTTFSFELRDLATILLGKVPSHWCLQGILALFSTVLLFVSPLDGWVQEEISMKVAWRKFDDICFDSLVLSDRKEIVQLLLNSTSTNISEVLQCFDFSTSYNDKLGLFIYKPNQKIYYRLTKLKYFQNDSQWNEIHIHEFYFPYCYT